MPKQELAKTKKAEIKKAETQDTPKLVISPSDIDIPRLNLVQKTSDINGPVGSVVLDKKHVLLEADESTEVIVVSALKRWRENIPFDNDEVPRIAGTEEERANIDASSEWGTIEFADLVLMFPQPDETENEEAYNVPVGDGMFALGKLNTAKDAYRMTYKRLATFSMFNPDASVSHRMWNFKSELITKGKYSWFAPSLSITKNEPSDEVKNFVNRLPS